MKIEKPLGDTTDGHVKEEPPFSVVATYKGPPDCQEGRHVWHNIDQSLLNGMRCCVHCGVIKTE